VVQGIALHVFVLLLVLWFALKQKAAASLFHVAVLLHSCTKAMQLD
jgi:hypothetical protein